MPRPGKLNTTVVTSDTTIKSAAGRVWWITISNSHASDSTAVELEDNGTDRWGVLVEAVDIIGLPFHAVFDPPIECNTGIKIDITGGTVKAVVAWT
ncbi:hypothetical protein LCGC14_2770340 [marine sediment metagenome]|uniref:Uncharacterized protein n=1 Tax=marine sediment metagenome TaxID=412755 RepID=A0A0F9BMW7_9ZZZZ